MKSKINVILLGILIFILGGVAGAAGHNLYWRYFKKSPKPVSFVDTLAGELKLDAGQKEKLKAITNETREQVRAAYARFKPQYEAINNELWSLLDEIRKESDRKIAGILQKDQKVLFEEFLKKAYKPFQIKGSPPNKNKPAGASD